jgi:hypothetical protein
VNNIPTATYWEVGRRIVEYEQQGEREPPMENVSWLGSRRT